MKLKASLTTSILIAILFTSVSVIAKELTHRQKLQEELEQLKASLKPLREKAYHEPEVIVARKEVDEAFRNYYMVLRKKMKELAPEQTEKIQRMLRLREELFGEHSGSRAEDYSKE